MSRDGKRSFTAKEVREMAVAQGGPERIQMTEEQARDIMHVIRGGHLVTAEASGDSPDTPTRIWLEVRATTDPAGQPAVLLQFSHGWLVTSPADARELAAVIVEVADELEGEEEEG